MLHLLAPQTADGILKLKEQLAGDSRAHKIDLGVGVYKDEGGATPIMRSIKAAEQRLWQAEDTKTYTSLPGDPAYLDAMRRLILGSDVAESRVAAIATPGGTGAVRQGFELLQMARPGARVFVTDSTWTNHLSILAHLGIEAVPFRYYDPATHAVDTDGMLADLAQLEAGDAVLLHGCCHNPTGADPDPEGWRALIEVMNARGAVPVIDLAYQGFGDGIDADAAATRAIADGCAQVLIAASCSKNFGIYRERTGILMAIMQDAGLRAQAQGALTHLNRQSYSFPPDHGARLVTMVLDDPALRADWQAELEGMRARMMSLRTDLAQALAEASGSDRFAYLTHHRGMFSRIGASPGQVDRLRDEHAIYMVGDGRINIAGLNARDIPALTRAMLDVGL
ncbi:aromatic amino acid aminotransferase [Pelagivirga sediminicola]|uniref:Aromatic amino acid aminotransferase n=1 Tax=Pelagivirga sediminicola TaxID=2170575 RepID=A0A2T7G4D9_9RHOB|nr:amino acid aminotransferase [Pelagivirga sediminicola]PVA09292.1 aromatic amino acid aminotransferase [Pelagivirga sediminicola]